MVCRVGSSILSWYHSTPHNDFSNLRPDQSVTDSIPCYISSDDADRSSPSLTVGSAVGSIREIFAKIKAIRDIAEKTLSGIVPSPREMVKLSDDEIIARLTEVRGVGRWTVEMLLIFTLGRQDVLPAGDLGVRKGFALTYGREELPTPKELLAHGERWRPHRTTATLYLYEAVHVPEPVPGVKLVRKGR